MTFAVHSAPSLGIHSVPGISVPSLWQTRGMGLCHAGRGSLTSPPPYNTHTEAHIRAISVRDTRGTQQV